MKNLKQEANCVVFALVFTLYLLLQLIYTVEPSNLLKTNRFCSLTRGGAQTINKNHPFRDDNF